MTIPKINLNPSSSSSSISSEVREGLSAFDNLVSMRHELSNICPPKIRIANELDDDSIYAEEKEDNLLFNPVRQDEVYLSIVKCHVCHFDIEVYSRRGRSEDYEAYNMICPVCDENFGEDTIRIVQNSSFPILGKQISNLQKHNVSNVNWKMHDKKDFCWSNLSSNDFISDDEDIISNDSDVIAAKEIFVEKSSEGLDAPNVADEQNIEERSNKAAFSQELLMSAMFLE